VLYPVPLLCSLPSLLSPSLSLLIVSSGREAGSLSSLTIQAISWLKWSFFNFMFQRPQGSLAFSVDRIIVDINVPFLEHGLFDSKGQVLLCFHKGYNNEMMPTWVPFRQREASSPLSPSVDLDRCHHLMSHHQFLLPFYYQIPTEWLYRPGGDVVAITYQYRHHRQSFATI